MIHQTLEQCEISNSRIGPGNVSVPASAMSAALTLATASHEHQIINATPVVFTLPAASGSGRRFKFTFGVAATATATVVAAAGTDVIKGTSWVVTSSSDNVIAFQTSATSDKASFNGTTQGGVVGDIVEVVDIAAGTWAIDARVRATGSYATPFSAT